MVMNSIETRAKYICLGQTVPEESKKYGLRVCTAGFDLNTNELIRIYPLGVKKNHHFKRWNTYVNLPVRRNNKDSRKESWRLNIDIDQLSTIEQLVLPKSKRMDCIEYLYQKTKGMSIDDLNEARLSLAVVKLINPVGYFADQKKKTINTQQGCLFDLFSIDGLGKSKYKLLPRIKWLDEFSKEHDYMFNSWDAYMHQVNLAQKYGNDNLWDATMIRGVKEKYALIGNMNHQRNTWLIISVF